MIRSLAGATVVTPRLDAAIAAYRDYLGYRGAAPECVGATRANAWGTPQAAAARMVELRPESGERRFIRLIEGEPAAGFRALTTLGWTAIEIVVQDLAVVADRLVDSPFTIIGAPTVLDFDFTDCISAMQVVGPGGEILYLTQIDGEVPGFDLPAAGSMIGQMFIVVLGAPSLEAGAASYGALGRPTGPTIAARIDILSTAFGLPPDHRHKLTTIELGDRSFFEIDAFPPAALLRPASTIGLPSGIAMVTLNDSAVTEPCIKIGKAGEWIELVRDGSKNNKKM